MQRVHLDTDFGGDPDDACALAMLLGWSGVEIAGITTTIDPGGRRAAYVAHVLRLAGRAEIPLAAGAAVSLTTRRVADPMVNDARYWPLHLGDRPSSPGAALDLLARSIASGAAIIAIGPYTNLAMLEIARPGALRRTPVTVMGGWVDPPGEGLPNWGPAMDFNVQWDTRAAEIVATSAQVTLSTLAASLLAPLRAADLPRLRAAGPLGALLARQSEAYAQDSGMAALGAAHPGLPDDLINIHWDPLACAVALGWPGAVLAERRLRPVWEGDLLRFADDPHGRPMRVLTAIDGERFRETWLTAIDQATRSPSLGSTSEGRNGQNWGLILARHSDETANSPSPRAQGEGVG